MANELTLEELYTTIDNLRRGGFNIPDDLLSQINEKEEQLIKTEVLPVIHETIEPTLAPVQRPLVLVVEYDPNGTLKVNLSRKVNVASVISDAKEITPDPIAEHGTQKAEKKKKIVTNPRTRLRITMPNGAVIAENTAWESLHKFVLTVGVEKVREVGLIANKMPLVTNSIDPKYRVSQKPLHSGWYLMTCSDTLTKKRQIEAIAAVLGLKVKVDVI